MKERRYLHPRQKVMALETDCDTYRNLTGSMEVGVLERDAGNGAEGSPHLCAACSMAPSGHHSPDCEFQRVHVALVLSLHLCNSVDLFFFKCREQS